MSICKFGLFLLRMKTFQNHIRNNNSEIEVSQLHFLTEVYPLIRSYGQYYLIIVPIGNIHNMHGLLNGNALFCPKNNSRFLLPFCVFVDFPFALGKSKSKALGEFAVNIKNINNKKTISVMDDILKSGLTLFLPFNFILSYSGSFNKSRNSTAFASIL